MTSDATGRAAQTTPKGTRTSRRATPPPKSFFERYRTLIIGGVAVVAVVALGVLAFQSASASGYTCSTEWVPAPTSPPVAGATPALGYVQPDQGRGHDVDSPQNYRLCPPASGPHKNVAGAGPITARFYDLDDKADPTGWIHNLEHGGIVILYRCDDGDTACTPEGQSALQDAFRQIPSSPLCNLDPGQAVVIARFDGMAWPYAAVVWNRVLPLDTLDLGEITEFFAQWGERTNPERFCEVPSPTPASVPSSSVVPSAGPSGSASPAASGSPEASSSTEPSPEAS